MVRVRWEYCLIMCTPFTGLDDDEGRIRCQVFTPAGCQKLDIRSGDGPPLVGVGQVLNQLGQDGWELVAHDTTTHRGVLKRPLVENGASV